MPGHCSEPIAREIFRVRHRHQIQNQKSSSGRLPESKPRHPRPILSCQPLGMEKAETHCMMATVHVRSPLGVALPNVICVMSQNVLLTSNLVLGLSASGDIWIQCAPLPGSTLWRLASCTLQWSASRVRQALGSLAGSDAGAEGLHPNATERERPLSRPAQLQIKASRSPSPTRVCPQNSTNTFPSACAREFTDI